MAVFQELRCSLSKQALTYQVVGAEPTEFKIANIPFSQPYNRERCREELIAWFEQRFPEHSLKVDIKRSSPIFEAQVFLA
uniref:Uncharacterized protein n=1 Tax=viral metagenome TaxID=1070528 RepID=A0A6H1ZGB3_9ZZZZ